MVAEGVHYRWLADGPDPQEDDWHQKRVTRTQRRHLAAVQTLAQVRKVGIPVMQVNIGEKHIKMMTYMSGPNGTDRNMSRRKRLPV